MWKRKCARSANILCRITPVWAVCCLRYGADFVFGTGENIVSRIIGRVRHLWKLGSLAEQRMDKSVPYGFFREKDKLSVEICRTVCYNEEKLPLEETAYENH